MQTVIDNLTAEKEQLLLRLEEPLQIDKAKLDLVEGCDTQNMEAEITRLKTELEEAVSVFNNHLQCFITVILHH